MQRLLQLAALTLALVVLGFLACRAQPSSSRAPAPAPANPAAAAVDAGTSDAPARAAPPDVYLPASKSGGMFLEHQQAPR